MSKFGRKNSHLNTANAHVDKQTHRDIDRQTHTQTDRHTNKHTLTH